MKHLRLIILSMLALFISSCSNNVDVYGALNKHFKYCYDIKSKTDDTEAISIGYSSKVEKLFPCYNNEDWTDEAFNILRKDFEESSGVKFKFVLTRTDEKYAQSFLQDFEQEYFKEIEFHQLEADNKKVSVFVVKTTKNWASRLYLLIDNK